MHQFMIGVPGENIEKAFNFGKDLAKKQEDIYGKFEKYSYIVSEHPPLPDYQTAAQKAIELLNWGNANPSKRSFQALCFRYLNQSGDIEFLFFGWDGYTGSYSANFPVR